MKTCRNCKKTKPLADFHSHKSCKFGVRPECKKCHNPISNKRHKKYITENPEKRRSTVLLNKYGIGLQEYNEMLVEQNNCCKICGSTDPGAKGTFSVDHNHKTGRVRGLLCHLCNVGLGSFKDNTEILRRAIKYLEWNNG